MARKGYGRTYLRVRMMSPDVHRPATAPPHPTANLRAGPRRKDGEREHAGSRRARTSARSVAQLPRCDPPGLRPRDADALQGLRRTGRADGSHGRQVVQRLRSLGRVTTYSLAVRFT